MALTFCFKHVNIGFMTTKDEYFKTILRSNNFNQLIVLYNLLNINDNLIEHYVHEVHRRVSGKIGYTTKRTHLRSQIRHHFMWFIKVYFTLCFVTN